MPKRPSKSSPSSNTNEDEMWCLIYCKADGSYSIVKENAVVTADEGVKKNDVVTFFYGNKSFVGEIVSFNADRDILDEEVKKLGKTSRKEKVKVNKDSVEGKRKVTAPVRFCPIKSSSPDHKAKKSKSSKKVSKELRDKGAKAMCKSLLHDGGSDEGSLKLDSDSDDDQQRAVLSDKKKKQENRSSILNNIRESKPSSRVFASGRAHGEDSGRKSHKEEAESTETKDSTIASPTKEELKRMYSETQQKLQMFIDDATPQDKDKAKKFDKKERTQKVVVEEMEEDNKPTECDIAASNFSSSVDSADINSFKSSDNDEHEMIGNGDDGFQDNVKDEFREELSDSFTETDLDYQLFGKDCPGHTMVRLGGNIYCKNTVLERSLRQSVRSTGLARSLLRGVFKESAIINSTLTGQLPRSAGKDNYSEEVTGLHAEAIHTIVSFSLKIGKNRQWEKASVAQVRAALTQCVGDITRQVAKKNDSKRKEDPPGQQKKN